MGIVEGGAWLCMAAHGGAAAARSMRAVTCGGMSWRLDAPSPVAGASRDCVESPQQLELCIFDNCAIIIVLEHACACMCMHMHAYAA